MGDPTCQVVSDRLAHRPIPPVHQPFISRCYNASMAPQFDARNLISLPLGCALVLGLFTVAPSPVFAHQLTNPNGTLIPHNHVYKRSGYGDGIVSGHVAPTRHGHNMIIWSPTAGNSYGSSVPQMYIQKPGRYSRTASQRKSATTGQSGTLRDLDPRNPQH